MKHMLSMAHVDWIANGFRVCRYRTSCTCGWKSALRPSPRLARCEANAHLQEKAVIVAV